MPHGTDGSSNAIPFTSGASRSAFLKLGIFLAVLVACFAVDHRVYQFVHENYNFYTRPVPPSMSLVTRILRSFENWGENVYILIVGFAIWRLDTRRRSRVVALAVAAIIVSLSVEGIKRVTGRARPDTCEGRTIFHGPTYWSKGGDFQSFPSGHAASSAAYSGVLSAFYPPLRPAFLALAAGCGANRIWKERHFLSDVWMGGAFGFWFGATLPRRRWIQRLLARFDAKFSIASQESTAISTLRSAA